MPRHLSAYTSLDAEPGFIADHRDVMAVDGDAIAGTCACVADRAGGALSALGIALPAVPEEILALHFADAQRLITDATGERLSASPTDPERPEFSNSFDLLFPGPGAEHRRPARAPLRRVSGRAARVDALRERGQSVADYASYLHAFEYGMPPHGGFAIGLERWVARLTGAANIRETTLFRRDLTRLAPQPAHRLRRARSSAA